MRGKKLNPSYYTVCRVADNYKTNFPKEKTQVKRSLSEFGVYLKGVKCYFKCLNGEQVKDTNVSSKAP